MNWYIWGGVILCILLLLFSKVGKKRPYCTATLWEYINGAYIKHDIFYECYIQKMRNNSGDKTIYWTEIIAPQSFIKGLLSFLIKPKTLLWRPINHKDITSTKQGSRHINLLWLGKNDFRIMKPNMTKFKYVPLDDGRTYKREFSKSLELEIMNDEDHYFLAEVYDQIEMIYKKKEGLMDMIKPYIPLAIIAIACIIMVYASGKNMSEMSTNMNAVEEKRISFEERFMGYMGNITGQKIDENTVKNQRGS